MPTLKPTLKPTAKPALKTTRRRLRPEGPRLTREDWLAAAHAAVIEGGFQQLRVLPIAQALKVSRGSFYWHFSGLPELQAELLERWRGQQLALDAELQATTTSDAVADIERVLDIALSRIGPRLEQLRFELALRDLGQRDAGVARLLADVDALRLSLFERKFKLLTGDAQTARELAALFYLAVAGSWQALSRPTNPPQMKQKLQQLIVTHLVRPRALPATAVRPAARRSSAR